MLNLLKKTDLSEKQKSDKEFITTILNIKPSTIPTADFKRDVLLKNKGEFSKRLAETRFFIDCVTKDVKIKGKSVQCYIIGNLIEHTYRIKPDWINKIQTSVK